MKYLVGLLAALCLLVAAPAAHATHTVEWAEQQACAATQAYGQAAVSPYGGCVPISGGWFGPPTNRFRVTIAHYYPGGCSTHNPWALIMGALVTDGGAVTTNTADWYWSYYC